MSMLVHAVSAVRAATYSIASIRAVSKSSATTPSYWACVVLILLHGILRSANNVLRRFNLSRHRQDSEEMRASVNRAQWMKHAARALAV